MRSALLLLLLPALLLIHAAADDKPKPKIPFLSPEAAIEKMELPEGFRVNAFAADAPQVVQPFAFAFDDRGRMWVAENLNYHTRKSDLYDKGPLGRIAILSDTDGDGTMDERKVFVDKILFPAGLALGFGGVWVGSPPNLYFIPDRDGDDVPDAEPEVILDGWGRQDRHETLNSFLWGPDGWLYGCHGVFTHSKVGKPGTPDNERQKINAGVWRLHPITHEFEVFAWGTSNPWGLDFNDHGQAFITACVIPHLWHMIQGGRYHRQGGKHFNPHVYEVIRTVADHKHMSAHGGARFYLADQFPEAYRGRLFMCNLHEHNVITDILERRGTGYVGKHGDAFMTSNDPQWLGFNMELGPDGALYIIDWHDSDICGRMVLHEETGRVWRMSYGDMKGIPTFDLAKKTDAELVLMQIHANEWYVRQARRLLQERAAADRLHPGTRTALMRMLEVHPDTPRKLRALWALHVTDGLEDSNLVDLLEHEDEALRGWAIQLLCEDRKIPEAAGKRLVTMAKNDDSAFVRLYLASAAQRLGTGDLSWDILAALAGRAEDHDDHNQPLMIWYGLEPMVADNPDRALALQEHVRVKHVAGFIDRRLGVKKTKPEKPPTGAVKVKPAESVPHRDMVLWFRADGVVAENKQVVSWTDRRREGRHATAPEPANRPALIPSLNGRPAVRFDGKDDRLVLPHEDALAFATDDDYTLAAWVHVEEKGQGGWRTIVAKSRKQGPFWGLWINPDRKWTFGGDNVHGCDVQPGWRQVCLVQHDGARRVYVDGALVGEGKARNADGPGDLWIGAAEGVSEAWRGALSELRLYRRALSHPEVAHLANLP